MGWLFGAMYLWSRLCQYQSQLKVRGNLPGGTFSLFPEAPTPCTCLQTFHRKDEVKHSRVANMEGSWHFSLQLSPGVSACPFLLATQVFLPDMLCPILVTPANHSEPNSLCHLQRWNWFCSVSPWQARSPFPIMVGLGFALCIPSLWSRDSHLTILYQCWWGWSEGNRLRRIGHTCAGTELLQPCLSISGHSLLVRHWAVPSSVLNYNTCVCKSAGNWKPQFSA
jgi:hypothetical protein